MIIRAASESDVKKISFLGARTFADTYAEENKSENTKKYIECNFSEEKILQDFNLGSVIYLLGEINGETIGYIKLNQGHTEPSVFAKNPIELEKIYLHKNFHGQGFGKQLMDEAIRLAQSFGHDKLWLGVWENNTKAIQFYKSYGFVLTGEHVFMYGDEAHNDYIFEFHLKP
jgi:ribosomal protein S18 acetylase RimI-like enzyme